MSKIKLGDTYTEKVRYTQANVDTFAQISGDNNPIHINPEYASKSIFGRCIVHGFFAGAVFSKVFGTQWPGEGTIYLYQEMKFMSPVFVEQDYNAVFEVVELDEVKHRGTIKCTLQDADGKVAIAGTAKLLNAERF
ncbi:MAG: MaoC family dehydratase [Bacteroidales bacterium]|jgi:acyl dehydratase|nr:MaoC family dehydratase [Bacteroidales bacterium]MBQ1652306.1 MaoC family dehydratase [Bacteroidales bacterium]MBQ1694881.1 MaoC family dehydratase [Bacteroidales bacterium]MBQ1719707.1 MaoC family dehydratase [Bacteroidales bacterium]MBQ1733189.1 MaoC family dehydratase [Bacteroidales bacterium]